VAPAGDASYLSGPVEPAPSGRTPVLAIATAVVGVLAIAAIVVMVIYINRASHASAVAKARVDALKAATAETAAALTYNYQTLDSDFAKAEAGMSTSFRANYAQTASQQVAPLARHNHAVTTGTIAAAGVISATATKVQVLVFADQTVQNKLLNATSRLDRSVIQVSMIKQGGHWVIDGLTPF
jgi:Mce-associated membrane protein